TRFARRSEGFSVSSRLPVCTANFLAGRAESESPMKARLLGIVVTAAILAGGYWVWTSPDGAGGLGRQNAEREGGPQHRGGQLVTSGRAGPRTFNRFVGQDQLSSVLSMLTMGHLLRVNLSTFEVEPWLAEKWDASADNL